MLNLQRLRMLHELHVLGTVGAVADVLHYTHSAVSQQLAQLEKETGFKLIEKAGRGVRLTDAGLMLAQYATKMVELSDEARAALATTAPVGGTLRVTSFQTALVALVPKTVELLKTRYPDLRIEFEQMEVLDGMESLVHHESDLCIGEQFPGTVPIKGVSVSREDFHREPLLLVQPAEGPLSGDVSLEEMKEYPWVLDPKESAAGQWAWSVLQAHGFSPYVFIESPDSLLALHVVRSGQAVALLPSLIASQFNDHVKVRELPGNPGRTLFTAVRTGREQHPAIVAFHEAIKEVAEGIQSS